MLPLVRSAVGAHMPQSQAPPCIRASLPITGHAGAGAEDTLSRRFGAELWAPYLRDTALRVFASVGLSGQVGRFTRPALDYTAGSGADLLDGVVRRTSAALPLRCQPALCSCQSGTGLHPQTLLMSAQSCRTVHVKLGAVHLCSAHAAHLPDHRLACHLPGMFAPSAVQCGWTWGGPHSIVCTLCSVVQVHLGLKSYTLCCAVRLDLGLASSPPLNVGALCCAVQLDLGLTSSTPLNVGTLCCAVRLDLGLTSPHQVGTLAGTSSYGNLAVFNPRHDSLAAGAAADADPPGPRRAFKSRQAVHAGGDCNCLHAMGGGHTAAFEVFNLSFKSMQAVLAGAGGSCL